MDGSITFNGHELTEFIPQRTAAYISQNDSHIGTLTVRETLDFSARCQGTSYRDGECSVLVGRGVITGGDE